MVDFLSYSPAMEGLHVVEDKKMHPVLTKWLSVVAPNLDLDSCIVSGVAILRVSKLA